MVKQILVFPNKRDTAAKFIAGKLIDYSNSQLQDVRLKIVPQNGGWSMRTSKLTMNMVDHGG